MPTVNWNEFQFPSTDRQFDMDRHNLADLEIRPAGDASRLHYFYDKRRRQLVTDFVLDEKPRVRLLCTVTLVDSEAGYSPRFKLWKQDKTKSGKAYGAAEVVDDSATRSIKALVDASDGHENLWTLIGFLQSFKGIAPAGKSFSVVDAAKARLASLLQSEERATVIQAIQQALGSSLTEHDIALMANRKQQLERFEKLLIDPAYFSYERKLHSCGREKLWQRFFEANQWIFGYGLRLVALTAIDDSRLEQITAGANLFSGAGKRADAVMRSRGFVSSLLFCEIKHHDTDLIEKVAYRPPDVFRPSNELSGAIAQVQKATRKAVRLLRNQIERHYQRDGSATGVEFGTCRPRQIVVVGNLRQLQNEFGTNGEQVESFELFRTSVLDTEVVTFDELFQRARYIVQDAP